ncbi:hypothetical protein [Nocardiopsis flavescens]
MTLRASTAPRPFTTRAPLPSVGEHTLVRAVGDGPFPAETELDRLAASVWRLVHDLERLRPHLPLTVLEIASRTGLSRGVAVMALTELLLHRRVRVSRSCTAPRTPMAEVRDNLAATHFDPHLRSVKILVLGTPELAARRFVGSCSFTHPVTVQESILEPCDLLGHGKEATSKTPNGHGPEGTRRAPLRSLLVSLGTLPLGTLHLCLLALSEPPDRDALWPGAARDACGALLIAHPDHLGAAARALPPLRDLHVPVQVVLDHPDGTAPDISDAARLLRVDPEHMTMADVRSVPSARATLRDLIHQAPDRPGLPHPPHPRSPQTPCPADSGDTAAHAGTREGRS